MRNIGAWIVAASLCVGCGSSCGGASAGGDGTGRCGNGRVEGAEVCDAGAANSGTVPGACRTDCTPARCGDRVIDPDESCDDGPANDDDAPGACRTSCVAPACGDGVVDPGESCDRGASNDDTAPDACRTTCVSAACGDGVRDRDEECDSGEANSDSVPDACRTTCRAAACGDHVVDAAEDCDDGNRLDWDGCSAACRIQPVCGPLAPRVIDLASAGTDAGEGAYTWSGSTATGSSEVAAGACGGPGPELAFLYPVPRHGGLVVEVTVAPGGPRLGVTVGARCADGEGLRCQAAGSAAAGNLVLTVPELPAELTSVYVVVDTLDAAGGPFQLRVGMVSSDPADVCDPRDPASCPPGLACSDPDYDSIGTCVPVVGVGEICDPFVAGNLCTNGARCQADAAHVYRCVPAVCGDGVEDGRPSPEECDDGNLREGDGCSATCEVTNGTCADPADLTGLLDPATRTLRWRLSAPGHTEQFTASCIPGPGGPDAVARFTAPEDGTWAFQLEGVRDAAVVLWPDGTCGAAEAELACGTSGPGVPPRVLRTLAAGESVSIGVDAIENVSFSLTVSLPVCGNGRLEAGEDCEPGAGGAWCGADCRWTGRSCTAPMPLSTVNSSPYWRMLDATYASAAGGSCSSDAGLVAAVAEFVAPTAGTYAFRGGVEGGGALYVRLACGAGATELGCRALAPNVEEEFTLDLTAGQKAFVSAEGPPGSYYFVLAKRVVCGDGVRAGTEACDDGNVVAGDGCSPACALEWHEVEPNETPAAATALLGTGWTEGSLPAPGDIDTFVLPRAPADRNVVLWMYLGRTDECVGSVPGQDLLRLRLVDAQGTVIQEDPSYLPSRCPWIAFRQLRDTIAYVQVIRGADAGNTAIGPYYLETRW